MTDAAFTPRARREVLAAIRWILRDNPAAARGLRDAVVGAAHRIASYPESGITRPELAREPYRFLSLTGYPYVIVYNPARNLPLIVRVVHGARDLPELLRDLRDL
jgi:toxin ParE1/3/4